MDNDLVVNVLSDGEEVYFELESYDLWLLVIFNLFSEDNLLIYGNAEFRIEKHERLENLKKKLQKFTINMWSKMHKGSEVLYIMESFDLKTDSS